MKNVIDKINSLYPISDDTIQTLKENVSLCHFPKRFQLIKANQFCKSAYFIEKGMTRGKGVSFSVWMSYTIIK